MHETTCIIPEEEPVLSIPAPRPRLRAGPVAVLLFAFVGFQFASSTVLGIVLGIVIGVIALVNGQDVPRSELKAASGLLSILCIAVSGVVVLLLARGWFGDHLRDGSRNGAAWLPGCVRHMGVAILMGVVLGWGHLWLTVLLTPTQASGVGPLTEMATKPGLSRTLWVLLALLWAPPVEELLFRGVAYGGLHRSWGPVWAAVVTTVVFVGLHIGEIWYFWPAALSLTVMASMALALRLRTQAMGPPVALHYVQLSVM